jgi:hypothetical protein
MQSKKMMARLGNEKGGKIYAPEKIAEGSSGKLAGKRLTVDLGVFFRDTPLLIPDPYPVVVKTGVNFSKFHGTPLLAGCSGIKEIDAATSLSSTGSYYSESEALTGEPGDAMMGEAYEETSVMTHHDETPIKVPP